VNSPLLLGIVGSTAYGLGRTGSDVDRLGVYAAPTFDFARLYPLAERKWTIVQHKPSDVTLHEAGKFCRLALNGNPTITEAMWLPDDLYEVRTDLGNELIGIRSAFLSAERVKLAYLGYVEEQFVRLVNKGEFKSTYRARTEKHARHIRRLLDQGIGLYATGRLEIRVEDPERYFDFGRRAAADPDLVTGVLAEARETFAATRSPLPDRPDEATVERWLLRVRAAHLPEATDAGLR
jgi:hypothetical protein